MQPLDRVRRRFVPHRTGDASPLGQLESLVMDAVWAAPGPLSVSDVQETLDQGHAPAYNTVKTTMERLAEKGILRRSRSGKAYLYRADATREELERRIVAGALDRLVQQFPDAVASFFVEPDPGLSAEKLLLLQDAVERCRQEEEG